MQRRHIPIWMLIGQRGIFLVPSLLQEFVGICWNLLESCTSSMFQYFKFPTFAVTCRGLWQRYMQKKHMDAAATTFKGIINFQQTLTYPKPELETQRTNGQEWSRWHENRKTRQRTRKDKHDFGTKICRVLNNERAGHCHQQKMIGYW